MKTVIRLLLTLVLLSACASTPMMADGGTPMPCSPGKTCQPGPMSVAAR